MTRLDSGTTHRELLAENLLPCSKAHPACNFAPPVEASANARLRHEDHGVQEIDITREVALRVYRERDRTAWGSLPVFTDDMLDFKIRQSSCGARST
jgi:hypothetical protein